MPKEIMEEHLKRYEGNTHAANATFDSGKLNTEEMADLIFKDLNVQ